MSTEEKIIKPKLGLLELAKQLGNVSQACKVMGLETPDIVYHLRRTKLSTLKTITKI
ncbi:hypothetical protein [Flagellimonas baculiformis]|uniref:hypothetical protein n=1 Tax=Flagellimonas baculiformis TaxID=3067310 RepID=UPI00296F6970|nr:hypothetical protein [Muricauda sp. D6]